MLEKFNISYHGTISDYADKKLEKHFGKDASTILVQSDFLKRLADDPMYVHHYDETYWAERIRALHEKKSSSTVN